MDILNTRAPIPAAPLPHPVIDALLRAGGAATARRNAHHAETMRAARAAPRPNPPPAPCAHVLRPEDAR